METVVLVLTDVQGSTRLWQDEPTAMDAAMTRHHEIVHGAVAAHDGWRPVDQGEGDAVFAAFRSATAAVAAVVQVQRELAAEPWPTSVPLKVRIGVHVGEVTERGGNLFGDPVNRCARLRGLGAGGQTLLSSPVYELVRDKLPTGASVTDLGEHRMKDLTRPERVWQLDLDGLTSDFPPLSSLDRVLHNLPIQPSPLIGREAELAAVVSALGSSRLVTLTGFGGMGKTRLSLQAAAELVEDFRDGVWFVDLAAVTDPDAVPGAIGQATGLGGGGAGSVIDGMSGQQVLLVLDNLEQVLGCAGFVADLLGRVPGVKVLATSREPLRVRGEQELALSPLALPPTEGPQDAETLSAYAAVQLFVERAVAVKASFAVTNDNAPAVAAICQHLDGHPLAIELAAARVRMMTPQSLLPRLDQALSVLTGGSRDLPGRHQTLRATIAWSYDLLEPHEKLLLDRMSVFAGPVEFEHVEAVCGEDLDVFDALASLVDKSLVRPSLSDDGEDRYGLLVSIKAFAAEQLAAAEAEMPDRHADWVIELATLAAPFTSVEVLARDRRVAELLDELTAAWLYLLSRPNDARVRTFPSYYFERVYEQTLSSAALDVFIERNGNAATPELLQAVALRAAFHHDLQEPVPPALIGRAAELAAAFDRPDLSARVLMDASYHPRATLQPEQRREAVARLDALLARVPANSPLSRERLLHMRDNFFGMVLQFIDRPGVLAAARRSHSHPLGGHLDLYNLGLTLQWEGCFQEVVDLTQPIADAGPARLNLDTTSLAMGYRARALVELGQAQRAIEELLPWELVIRRRGWKMHLELLVGARACALTALARVNDAADLMAGLDRPLTQPASRLLELRIERLAGHSDDPEDAVALSDELHNIRWQWMPIYLCSLLEQALRERSAEVRETLLTQVEQDITTLVLPLGYQTDLARLRERHLGP